jgi:hypothetical protein
MSEARFTVFARKDGSAMLFFASNAGKDRPQTVEGLIAYVLSKNAFPVAWANGYTINDGGDASKDDLHSESIAAGRLIDCIDGKYIPRMPADADEQREIDAHRTQPAHVSHCEPERAPLPHFNQRTKFDPFGPDFKVYSDAASSGFAGSVPRAPAHPLQRMNDGTALCGSAHLLQAA